MAKAIRVLLTTALLLLAGQLMASGDATDCTSSCDTVSNVTSPSQTSFIYASDNDGFQAGAEFLIPSFPRTVWSLKYNATPRALQYDANGHLNACFNGGKIDGPYGNPFEPNVDQYTFYECTSEHGAGGLSECGDPPVFPCCLGFHTTGRSKELYDLAPDESSASTYRISHGVGFDGGDGVSTDHDAQPTVTVSSTYLADIHDDAFESDSHARFVVDSVLVERAFMGIALHGDNPMGCDGRVQTVNLSMIELHRFTNTYKQKPGHGGFWKLNNEDDCRYWMDGSYFLAGVGPNAMGDGQTMVPPVNRTHCSGDNWLGWAGTASQWNEMIPDASSICDNSSCRTVAGASPGAFANNGQRLAWFDSQSECLSIFFRGDLNHDCVIDGADDGFGSGAVNSACIENPSETVRAFLVRSGWKGARDSFCTAHSGVCRPYQH